MNLPDLYARVVAKRPELAVEGLHYIEQPELIGPHWCYKRVYESNPVAAALILARWVEGLPVCHCLTHGDGTGSAVQWWVSPAGKETWCVSVERTPIEALAAFYLEEA